MTRRKVIVTVAPTSNFHGKEANPALPVTPAEIADSVYDCYNAGASVVHLHARDENMIQSNDVNIFRDMNNRIRQKCNIILQNSTAPANKPGMELSIDDGLSVLDAGAEMLSLDCGPLVVKFGDVTRTQVWTRDWLTNAASEMQKRNLKPEMEIFNNTNLEDVINVLKPAGVINMPPSVTLVLGMNRAAQGGMEYSMDNLYFMVKKIPSEFVWTAMGIGGANQHRATCGALLLGGNVRVGFEDNIYYRPGELATSNAQLVERIVLTIRDMGMEPATPDEAREILCIKKQ